MTAAEVFKQALREGVTLYLDGDVLRYRATRGALSKELRDAVRSCKPEIVQSLRQEAALRSGQAVLFVRCAHLDGEIIALVADAAELTVDELGRYSGCVVYRVSELEKLRQSRPSPAMLRALHENKKNCAGGTKKV
jgi:hypothetical protein